MSQNIVVWYDGACPLCKREIGLMKFLDRKGVITFLDVSDQTVLECPIDRSTLLERFHVAEGDRLLSGAAAFAAMWRAIPILKPLGFAAKNAFVLRLLETMYVYFLRFRPKIQSWLIRNG